MKEADWQRQVIQLAMTFGWMVQHSRVSKVGDRHMTAITGHVGFPDLVLAHRTKGVVFVELKAEKGSLRKEQVKWRDTLVDAGAEWYLWRPDDLMQVMKRLSNVK